MKGKIKTYKKESGFGFIKSSEDGKDYFFHRSCCPNRDFDSMQEGDEVEFEESETVKGLRAEDVVRM